MANKKNRSRKSLAVALAIVGVAGLSMASAAQLTVDSTSIAAGVDTFAACDPDGVTVDYTSTWDDSAQAFLVDDVVISGVHANCATLAITVEVLGTGPAFAAIEEISGTALVGVTTLSVVGPIDVEDVYGTAVQIG